MSRHRVQPIIGRLCILLGLWIVVLPFSRPLPGGAQFDLSASPKVSCGSPVVNAFDSQKATGTVYTTPRPNKGDPTVKVEIDCTGRARFRLGLGFGVLASGLLIRRRTLKL